MLKIEYGPATLKEEATLLRSKENYCFIIKLITFSPSGVQKVYGLWLWWHCMWYVVTWKFRQPSQLFCKLHFDFLIYTRRKFPLSNASVGTVLKKVCFGVLKSRSNLRLMGTWLHSVAGSNLSVVGNTFARSAVLETVGVQHWWVQRNCSRSWCTRRRSSMIMWWLLPVSSFRASHHMDFLHHWSREWRKWRC